MFSDAVLRNTLNDVKCAIKRAKHIALQNKKDSKKVIKYSGYSYYRDNPALSINEVVEKILIECGVMQSL